MISLPHDSKTMQYCNTLGQINTELAKPDYIW